MCELGGGVWGVTPLKGWMAGSGPIFAVTGCSWAVSQCGEAGPPCYSLRLKAFSSWRVALLR